MHIHSSIHINSLTLTHTHNTHKQIPGIVLGAVCVATGGIWETHWLPQLLQLDLREKHTLSQSHTHCYSNTQAQSYTHICTHAHIHQNPKHTAKVALFPLLFLATSPPSLRTRPGLFSPLPPSVLARNCKPSGAKV